jgi:hypothetical protein
MPAVGVAGQPAKPAGKEEAVDAREGSVRRVGGDDAITTRLGAAALPLGIIVLVVSEVLHPSRQDPMDNPAVFAEYADSDIWTAVHLAQWFGFLLLLGGLVALYYSLKARPGVGAGLAPFGLAAAVTAAASFTVLQGVDGIALKRAVDAWANAPAGQEAAAFAAAKAIRWTEIAMNSLSLFLLGLAVFLFGLAIALGGAYPRWAGWMAAVSGAALMYNGALEVAYEGFVSSNIKLMGPLLLAVWAFVMAFSMWRNAGADHRRGAHPRTTPSGPTRRSANPR